MNTFFKRERKYAGQFHVEKIYPAYILKENGDAELIDAKTLSIILPLEEAINLSNALKKIKDYTIENVEIKIELRDEKRRKKDGLLPGTVTFLEPFK